MASALRTLRPLAGIGPAAMLWGLPLAGAVLASAAVLSDDTAWQALMVHPQLWAALALSLWTGSAALLLSLLCALVVAGALYRTPVWHRLSALAGLSLAIPHLAFAIGFGFLIMPSGLIARLIFATPPQWVTAQDPWGLSLVASLVLKETPFLLWMMWALLARGDWAVLLAGQQRSARSLGHGSLSVWLRVVLPQLLPRLLWPLIAVWVYGATVVDMALVIGPAQPPTLSVLIWADLNDADLAANHRGETGAVLLTLVLGGVAATAHLLMRVLRLPVRNFLTSGASRRAMPRWPGFALLALLVVTYGAVILVLTIMSVAGHWPFPQVLPDVFVASAWFRLLREFDPLATSLLLAVGTTLTSLTLAVLWLEYVHARLDRLLVGGAMLSLGLPAIVIASGQYRVFLQVGLTGTAVGLFLAHLTPVFAYVFVVLNAPYRGFDHRYRSVSLGLNATALRFWWRVKVPLLRAPLASAGAIGFAVSMAQFVPAQLIAAGRYSTLPMEAVTLASGGNRPLTAAYALALAIPPALVFVAASIAGRQRWS